MSLARRSVADRSSQVSSKRRYLSSDMWKIDGLEPGETIRCVTPLVGDFTERLVLTDRRLLWIQSPGFAASLGLARFVTSKMTLAREIENFTWVECKKRHSLSTLGIPVLTMEVGRANGATFQRRSLRHRQQMAEETRIGVRSDLDDARSLMKAVGTTWHFPLQQVEANRLVPDSFGGSRTSDRAFG